MKFLVRRYSSIQYTLEKYSLSKGISGLQALALFKEYGADEFRLKHYDLLHTQGTGYVLDEVQRFIDRRKKMRLYHGSVFEVRKPSFQYGRKKIDFGKGYYTTTQDEQTENWTIIKQDRTKAPKRIVSVYEIDDALLSNPELKFREFHGVDEPWLNFVVNSRKGIKHDYDLVFGPVANDKVFTTVNLYESGALDAPAAIIQPVPIKHTTSYRFIQTR